MYDRLGKQILKEKNMNKLLGLITFSLISLSAFAQQWTFSRDLPQGSRGGNSTGIPVKVDLSETATWTSLKDPSLTSYEKDRMAILALQGEFKASFEFMETVLLDTQLKKDTPYASWGTEIVKVIEDKGDFISLQHIMVIFMKDPDTGSTIGPMLVKHWRQDWQWEADNQLVFQGSNHWKINKLNLGETKGKWKWTVYQVDDTPRYSALGKWNHLKSASMFSSEILSRPLPRREFSVRSDYKLLLGMDTLVLTANSWYHEQKNFKHVGKLGVDSSSSVSPLLSREIGHNSYTRIKGFDFSAGYQYWDKSKKYWDDVRFIWSEIESSKSDYQMKKSVDGKKLFAVHFKNAENDSILNMTTAQRRILIKNLIGTYIK
jgi:hypothetical protein